MRKYLFIMANVVRDKFLWTSSRAFQANHMITDVIPRIVSARCQSEPALNQELVSASKYLICKFTGA
jgi:hypothetical protein